MTVHQIGKKKRIKNASSISPKFNFLQFCPVLPSSAQFFPVLSSFYQFCWVFLPISPSFAQFRPVCLFCERVFLEVHMVVQDRAQLFASLVDMSTCRHFGSRFVAAEYFTPLQSDRRWAAAGASPPLSCDFMDPGCCEALRDRAAAAAARAAAPVFFAWRWMRRCLRRDEPSAARPAPHGSRTKPRRR